MAKSSKVGQSAMWVLMGLLIVGLSGFGVSNFGGSVRKIGSVDGQDISTDEYFRNLRSELNMLSQRAGRGINLTEAQALGVDGAVRQRLVTGAVLDAEVARLELSVPDDRLAQEILGMPSFAGANGFDRNSYRALLQENGWTETQFEERMRGDIARGVMQTAVASGFAGSDTAATALLDFIEERRSFTVLRLTESDLAAPIAALSETEVRAFYDANPDLFTRPEARKITYAALLVDDAAKTIAVDEAELRRLYDSRLAEFVQPERRLVERLVFGDEASAQAARARVDAGEVSFADLVRERGLAMTDVDMGDVSLTDLGEAGAAIFALTEPGVVGPLPSPLGPALFTMNGVLPAEEITFDEAREALASEFSHDTARRAIAPKSEEIEDILAGGATLEDLAKEIQGMTLATIELEPDYAEGIAAYPMFRDRASKVNEGDFVEVFQLDDGSLAALRLDAVLPPALRPFDEIKDKAAELARAAAVKAALDARLAEAEAGVKGGAALNTFGTVTVQSAMPRGARVDGAPADLVERVFKANKGDLLTASDMNFVGLVQVDDIIATDHSSAEATSLKQALTGRMAQELGQDAFQLFTNALEARAKITLDQGAINAVHSQLR